MMLNPSTLEQLSNNDPDLILLNLAYAEINDSEACALADALKQNRRLTKLYLSNNTISDVGAIALANALKDNRTLTKLSLGSNIIKASGAVALASALKNNPVLTSLDLINNSVDDAGVRALADVLKDNSTLTALSLKNNSIGFGVGTAVVAHALIKSKNILYVEPDTNELFERCKENQKIAIDLIEKIKNNPAELTRNEFKEIQDRVPAILHLGEWDFKLFRDQIFTMLTNIGINPILGPVTERINEAREEQRRRAIEDPSQGI